jgi:OOP family OmpA-OmpF porin
VDTDKDGVYDYLDRCPNTPMGVKVDQNGCPADADKDGVPNYLDRCPDTSVGVKVDGYGCPADADQDSVPDYLDRCADTPRGVNVDMVGCPLDSDMDGVPDYLDKCPNTPEGVRVDKDGCPTDSMAIGIVETGIADTEITPAPKKELTTLKIEFDVNSCDINPKHQKEISRFVESIKKAPGGRVVIKGYAEQFGKEEKNVQLSYKRADALRKKFVEMGIASDRLRIVGHAHLQASSSPAKSSNRRAEAMIDYTEKQWEDILIEELKRQSEVKRKSK